MRVHKNIFGTDGEDKIDAGEIVVENKILSEVLNDLDGFANRFTGQYVSGGTITIELNTLGLYILMTGLGTNVKGGLGVYFINKYGGYSHLLAINESSYVTVTLEDGILTLNRSGGYDYGLLRIY